MAFKSQRPIREQIKLAKDQQAFGKKMSLANLLLQGITTGVGAYQGIQKGRVFGQQATAYDLANQLSQATLDPRIKATTSQLGAQGQEGEYKQQLYGGMIPGAKGQGESKVAADTAASGATEMAAKYSIEKTKPKLKMAGETGTLEEMILQEELKAKEQVAIGVKETARLKANTSVDKAKADVDYIRALIYKLYEDTDINRQKFSLWLKRAMAPKKGGTNKFAMGKLITMIQNKKKDLAQKGEKHPQYKEGALMISLLENEVAKVLAGDVGIKFSGDPFVTDAAAATTPAQDLAMKATKKSMTDKDKQLALEGKKADAYIKNLDNKQNTLSEQNKNYIRRSAIQDVNELKKRLNYQGSTKFKPPTIDEFGIKINTLNPVSAINTDFNDLSAVAGAMKTIGTPSKDIQTVLGPLGSKIWDSSANLISKADLTPGEKAAQLKALLNMKDSVKSNKGFIRRQDDQFGKAKSMIKFTDFLSP